MKNPFAAFILAFFPGGGLFYIGNRIRGSLYGAAVFGLAVFSIFLFSMSGYMDGVVAAVIFIGFLIYCISILDTYITASRYFKRQVLPSSQTGDGTERTVLVNTIESQRFYTIVLSFVPGLGHIQLGLMYRGITLLSTFLGLIIMVLFVSILTGAGEFLLFLAILPVIWVYGFFDVMQQFTKKQNGEELVDQSIFQDFEKNREDGKKSKIIATFLSIFPGAGHLYLGLQQRGLQLMAAFLFAIFLINELYLGIFLFLIPIIWFYSFFDGLQKASKIGEVELEDTPVIAYLTNYQKWVGVGLLLVGFYYMIVNILLPAFSSRLKVWLGIDLQFLFYHYFQTGVVCIILILGGLRVLVGNKKNTDK